VLKAFYGDQALEQIKQNRPSVVILDLQMPGMNGIAVLEKIRSDYPDTKVLVMTGFSEQYQEQLDRLKAEKVLAKPVSLMELTRGVEDLLEGKASPASSPVGPEARREPAEGSAPPGKEEIRLLFVEGSQEAYEKILKPYFESKERPMRCSTALARDPEEALRVAGEFKPQLVILDGSRMPIGVDAGRLAAQLTGVSEKTVEVILTEISSADYQMGVAPAERLERLEEAVLQAARKHRWVPHASK
jgi:CheY-like chemotaxis protein